MSALMAIDIGSLTQRARKISFALARVLILVAAAMQSIVARIAGVNVRLNLIGVSNVLTNPIVLTLQGTIVFASKAGEVIRAMAVAKAHGIFPIVGWLADASVQALVTGNASVGLQYWRLRRLFGQDDSGHCRNDQDRAGSHGELR
jgi:hypothetical protein